MTQSRRALKRTLLACLIGATLTTQVSAFTARDSKEQRNIDARPIAAPAAARAPIGLQAVAIESLRARVPELAVEIDGATGVTRTLGNRVGYLTGPNPGGDTKAVALGFVRENLALLGLAPEDLAEYEVTDDVPSRASGIRHLYLRQMHQGLPVYNGQLHVNIDRDGSILSINNQFLPRLAQSVNRVQPLVSAQQAVVAAGLLARRAVGPVNEIRAVGGPRQITVFAAPGISEEPVAASLMLLPVADGQARLVWNLQLWLPDGTDVSDYNIDAVVQQVFQQLRLLLLGAWPAGLGLCMREQGNYGGFLFRHLLDIGFF